MRGNPTPSPSACGTGGSIPACAGEPPPREGARRARGVYPRVCGGTRRIAFSAAGTRGLSPRVRGNRASSRSVGAYKGSIPACAGEPHRRPTARTRARVYPRVCGGTPGGGVWPASRAGLSPRVRGNLAHWRNTIFLDRSIPACAGEPISAFAYPVNRWVYPGSVSF